MRFIAQASFMGSFVFPALHFLNILKHVPSTVIVFCGIGSLLYCIHVLSDRQRPGIRAFLRFCFPPEHWFSHSTKVDIVFYLVSKITLRLTTLICSLGLAYGVSLLVLRARTHLQIRPIWHETLGLDLLLFFSIFVLTDLAAYLSHKLQHDVPALWEFHKVHHAATFLTPLTTFRAHPIESLIDGATYSLFLVVPFVVAELYAGMGMVRMVELSGTVELFFTLTFLRQLQHSHFRISFGPLDRVIISPVMHQVHHSTKPEHWNKNYGARLSLWDGCFGTAFFLPKSEKLSFGLGTEEDERGDYSSLLICYARPFAKFWQILMADFHEHMTTKPQAQVGKTE